MNPIGHNSKLIQTTRNAYEIFKKFYIRILQNKIKFARKTSQTLKNFKTSSESLKYLKKLKRTPKNKAKAEVWN